MYFGIFCFLFVVASANVQYDPVKYQLVNFKQKHPVPIGILTTTAGRQVDFNESRVTLNKRLLTNEFFLDDLTHFLRQNIPFRIVHAKGAGAFGYFEVTHNFTDICKAKLFEYIGKRTPVASRFSIASQGHGGNDLARDIRGFAIKFYTEEGNFDIAAISSPAFAFKDPLLFTTFGKVEQRNPVTNINDDNMRWDFRTIIPESLLDIMYALGDRGITDGYRHMPAFAVHTYQLVNHKGVSHFVRFHILPDAGIKTLGSQAARNIAAFDPDYATRDLYRAIGRGKYPSWTISAQVLSETDVKTAEFDVFDVTRILPLNKYPLRPLGKLVLNRNPENFFADVEQIAFCPANLVPGILGAPDKIFEARRFAYRDAQYYRLGANFHKIPINCPFMSKTNTYTRNGIPPLQDNGKDSPNYFPNTFSGPMPYIEENKVELIQIYEKPPNNFDQAGELYADDFIDGEKQRLVEIILEQLCGVTEDLKVRAVQIYYKINNELGQRVSEGLKYNCSTVVSVDSWMNTAIVSLARSKAELPPSRTSQFNKILNMLSQSIPLSIDQFTKLIRQLSMSSAQGEKGNHS